MLQEYLACLGTYARDSVKLGFDKVFLMCIAMEFYGVAVDFVLNPGQEMEEGTFDINLDFSIEGDDLRGAVTAVFGEAYDWNLQVELILGDAADDFHLTFAAIGDNEVG